MDVRRKLPFDVTKPKEPDTKVSHPQGTKHEIPPELAQKIAEMEQAQENNEHLAGSDNWQGDCYDPFV